MDGPLRSALDQLPLLNSSFGSLRVSAESAIKAAHSSTALLSRSILSSRRLLRAEHLLRHLRDNLPTLTSLLSAFLTTLRSTPPSSVVQTTAVTLPSQWCRAKLHQIIPMVSELLEHVAKLQALINTPSNAAFVQTVDAAANQACKIAAHWHIILDTIHQWQPIVVAAAEGLGEERSLVPN